MKMDPLRHQTVTRYIAPLREGGSLPLLVEADDGFRYAAKLRGFYEATGHRSRENRLTEPETLKSRAFEEMRERSGSHHCSFAHSKRLIH